MAAAKTPLEDQDFIGVQHNIKEAANRGLAFLTGIAEVFADATGEPMSIEDGFWMFKQALSRLRDKGQLTPGGLQWVAQNASRVR